MYSLYGLKHHLVEISGDVTDAGRDKQQAKIVLLSFWSVNRWVSQFFLLESQLEVNIAFQFEFTHSIIRSSCYTDGNGPEVFVQCSTKWIRNFDLSKDEYGDALMILILNPSSIHSSRWVQDYIRTTWLWNSFTTAKFREQDLWEISWANWSAEEGLK